MLPGLAPGGGVSKRATTEKSLSCARDNGGLGNEPPNISERQERVGPQYNADCPGGRTLVMPGRARERNISMIDFVVHDEKDSVGVVVVEGIKAGQRLTGWIMEQDTELAIQAAQDIPIGHKIAIRTLKYGDTVVKYGVDIGRVVAGIKPGEHAHVHNIKTKRW